MFFRFIDGFFWQEKWLHEEKLIKVGRAVEHQTKHIRSIFLPVRNGNLIIKKFP